MPQIKLLEGSNSWQLFARNLLLANTGISMLLGPEHGLVFVIGCPTIMRYLPQMAPTASHEYLCCLPRVSAAYLGLPNFAASSKKYLSPYR